MKFTINRDSFLKPLQAANSVIDKRSTLAVLSNVLLEVPQDNLRLLKVTATDLETQVRVSVPLESDAVAGIITAPARKLFDIVRTLSDNINVTFETKTADKASLSAGRSKFSLATVNASVFPDFAIEDVVFTTSIDMPTLKKGLDATGFCMANNDARYYLNGVLFEFSGSERLNLVATDGHRLALYPIEGVVTSSSKEEKAILPRKSVLELSKLINASTENTTITVGHGYINFTIENLEFTSKLIDGVYPQYRKVIPENNPTEVTANRLEVKNTIQRMSILANEKYKGIAFYIQGSTLKASSQNPLQEEAEEFIDVTCNDNSKEHGICFNAAYFADALSAMDGESVSLSFNDERSGIVIVDPEKPDNIYVVMPMKM